MDGEIRRRVLELNPWLVKGARFREEVDRRMPATFIRRGLDVSGFEDRARARIIVGPRQSGKSTLVWSMLGDREPGSVLFLNAEESLVRRWCGSAGGMLSDLHEELPGVRTLFFEEVQHLDEAGLLIKGLVDSRRGYEILVTGSSAFHLRDRTRESLAGRAERRVLLPLDLGEIMSHEEVGVPAAWIARAWKHVGRMMVTGSYPAVWLSADPHRELSDLVEAFVLRDASDIYRIRRPDAFRKLVQLAAVQEGQTASPSEWASILGVSASTVAQYLGILRETWIIDLLPPFVGGKRAEITSAPRVHFVDMGLRNAVLGSLDADVARRPDRGALAEGFAYSELMKTIPQSWGLHHWRTKSGAEVDFVLATANRCIGIEVKSGAGRLTRSALSFIEAYAPEAFLIAVGADVAPSDRPVSGTRVITLPLVRLAETVRSLF